MFKVQINLAHSLLRERVESFPHVLLQFPQLAQFAQPSLLHCCMLHVFISPSGPLHPWHIRNRHWIPDPHERVQLDHLDQL